LEYQTESAAIENWASMTRRTPHQGNVTLADRDAFDRAIAPYHGELLQAARREVRHRRTLGQFGPDNPTPEELLDLALRETWRQRQRLSAGLGIKALALAAIFLTGEALGERAAARERRTAELLPEEVEPDPIYQEDDEEFWHSYELEYPKSAQVFSGDVDETPDEATNDDELVGRLAPRERQVLLMHEAHGVSLPEIALALGIPLAEAQHLLARARRRLRPREQVSG
jgi:DNA-directed RNA polymerase specialized sigma24 family protein